MISDKYLDSLILELKAIFDDQDFVVGILNCIENDKNANELLKAIKSGTLKTVSDITLASINMSSNAESIIGVK